MAEERDGNGLGEETSKSGSAPVPSPGARSSLPPRKRLLTDQKQNGRKSPDSASSASFFRMRKKTRDLPNFTDCHGCGDRMNNKGKTKLQPLYSEWRIVLLCKTCFDGVEFASICSYCFREMCEEGVGCHECTHRVHYGCVLKFLGFASWSYPGPDSCLFTCIDCWIPKSLANSNGFCRSRNLSGDNKIVSNACSLENSRVSADGNCSKLLEDLVKDAEINAEKKNAFASRAREKALSKAVVAKRAAELARNALDFAVVAMREDNNGLKESPVSSASVVDDAELAFRLHRAMNSSPRISKNLCPRNSDSLVSPNSNSISSKSDSGSLSVCGKLEVCSDNKLFENPDRTVSEPSVRIDTLDHSIDLDVVEVSRPTSAKDEKRRGNGEDCLMGNSEMVESCLVKKYNGKDGILELPIKEEEASCSNKLINSSGDDNSMDSGCHSYQKQDEFENKVMSNTSGTNCQPACDGDSSTLQKKKCEETDRYLKKYSKRCSSSKAVSECKTRFIYEDFPIESQASVPGIPLLQLNCSKASRTFSDASFQSPSVPLQTPAYASGPSGCQS